MFKIWNLSGREREKGRERREEEGVRTEWKWKHHGGVWRGAVGDGGRAVVVQWQHGSAWGAVHRRKSLTEAVQGWFKDSSFRFRFVTEEGVFDVLFWFWLLIHVLFNFYLFMNWWTCCGRAWTFESVKKFGWGWWWCFLWSCFERIFREIKNLQLVHVSWAQA